MVQGLIGALALRIPLAFIYTSLPGANLFYLGLATPTSSLVQTVICLLYFRRLNQKLRRRQIK